MLLAPLPIKKIGQDVRTNPDEIRDLVHRGQWGVIELAQNLGSLPENVDRPRESVVRAYLASGRHMEVNTLGNCICGSLGVERGDPTQINVHWKIHSHQPILRLCSVTVVIKDEVTRPARIKGNVHLVTAPQVVSQLYKIGEPIFDHLAQSDLLDAEAKKFVEQAKEAVEVIRGINNINPTEIPTDDRGSILQRRDELVAALANTGTSQ